MRSPSKRLTLTAPGSSEALMFPGFLESDSVAGVLLPSVGGPQLGRRDVADRFEEPAVVEPGDPLEHRVLDASQPTSECGRCLRKRP
jgi:hypothetical protein